jgi:hypothetical protein
MRSAIVAILAAAGIGGWVMPRVQQPTFSISPGTYTSTQVVSASSVSLGSRTTCTTDGTVPGAGSSVGPFTISVTTTLSCRSFAIFRSPSLITTGIFTISVPPGGFMPPDRMLVFSPGIPGGIPTYTTNITTIDAATYGNGTTDATAAINSALATSGTAASPRVVYLPAGTYLIAGFINTSSRYVVLRGAGPALTKLRSNVSGSPAIRIGNFNWQGSTALSVVGSLPKGSTQMTLSSASSLRVGDIIQIDQLDDPSYVWLFDAIYSKRAPGSNANGPASSGATGHSGYRSVAEMKEITAINGNMVTFSPATRINFDSTWAPQAWKVIDGPNGTSGYGTRWVGIEDMYITGGLNDQIQFFGAAYSWVRNVESDGNPATGIGSAGRHIWISHGFRNEVRRCYVHHAASIVQGGGAYGISLGVSTSDSLVEDNVVVFLNKGVLTEVSGGGNVFGYNYIDNNRTNSASWMEGSANGCHQSFSHADLWEGNEAANIGADTTHGGSGGLIFYRNHAMGRASDPTYRANQTQNLRAANVDAWGREMTFIGNVMEAFTTGGNAPVYEKPTSTTNINIPAIWDLGNEDRLGTGGGGGAYDTSSSLPPANYGVAAGVLPNASYTQHAIDMIFRHGNWDSVRGTVTWDPGYSNHTLPDSLYLSGKPAFFGSLTWPWVNPNGATAAARVATLPARQRFDSGTPGGPVSPWPLVGTTHRYVAIGGSNSNAGTQAAPWATIVYAAQQATAGTIVHVGPGTFTGTIDMANSGTSWSNPITFVADQATRTSWPTTIVGQGQNRAISLSGQYVVIQGFDITCPSGLCYGGIHSYVGHSRFLGNNIHYTPPDCNTGGAGIQVDAFTNATDIVSDGNVVHDIWVSTSCGLTHGIYYASPGAGSIVNNVLYHNSGWGIHLYHCAKDIIIANNTVMTSGHSGILIGSYDDCGGLYGSGNIVANNIVTNSTAGCIEENNSGRTCNNTFRNNTCYSNAGNNGISLLPACGGGAQSTATGTLTTNPLFVNYQANGSGDYHLQAGSPSVDSGTTLNAPTWDYDWITRPTGAGIDRGAYER